MLIQNIPCTLVTGFLGAGKTTLINQLLATKPHDERWALLINEFGRIGIDGSLIAGEPMLNNGIAIREVNGGCICCTSQLPLQIAISRLLSEHHPQRLLIEPTGLAHPRELIRQLSEPHWQTALNMQAVITVLSAVQWQQDKYRTHEGYQAHVRAADILIVNRHAELSTNDRQALKSWIIEHNKAVKIIWTATDASNNADTTMSCILDLSAQLNQPNHTITHAQQSLSRVSLRPPHHLISSPVNTIVHDNQQNDELPYRYHDLQQNMAIAGWRLPPQWIFAADDLQQWLLQWPNWERIKGVIHTSEGWLKINFTPDSLTSISTSEQADSRLEIILQLDEKVTIDKDNAETDRNDLLLSSSINWEAYDRELMSMIAK